MDIRCKSFLIVSGLAVGLYAQSAQNFKIYGFMDAQGVVSNVNHPFVENYIGSDEISLGVEHVNVYFDWQASSRLQALAEINFMGTKSMTQYTQETGGLALSDPNGNLMTDAQFLSLMEGAIRSSLAQEGRSDEYIEAAVANYSGVLSSNLALLRRSTYRSTAQVTKTEQPTVERAYFDVVFTDNFKWRTGKFITPAGIWNVDHGSPVVLTIRQPLQTTNVPIFPESQTGVMVHGRYFLGDHDLDYAFYATSGRDGASNSVETVGNFSNGIDDFSDLTYGGHLGLRMDYLDGISLGISGLTGKVRNRFTVVTPVLDATKVAEVLLATQDPDEIQAALAQMVPADVAYRDSLVTDQDELVCGVDAKIEVAGATVQGELNYRIREDNLLPGNANRETWGMYGILSYRIPLTTDFSLTPYGMMEHLVFRNNGTTETALRGFDTYVAGLNLSLYTNIHIKAEWDYFGLLRNTNSAALPESFTTEEMYSYLYNLQLSVAF